MEVTGGGGGSVWYRSCEEKAYGVGGAGYVEVAEWGRDERREGRQKARVYQLDGIVITAEVAAIVAAVVFVVVTVV